MVKGSANTSKKFVSPRRARHNARKVWSFTLTVLCVCIALVAGALLERKFGYQQPVNSSDLQASTSVQQNQVDRLLDQSLEAFAAEIAQAKINLKQIEQITERLAKHPSVNLDIPSSEQRTEDDGAGQSPPMLDENYLEADDAGERIGRELDQLKQRLSHQEMRLRTFDVMLQRRRINLSRIPTSMPVSMLEARLTSPYGWRRHPITRATHLHTGIDLAAPRGTPIYAASSGIVSSTDYRRGYGLTVEIDHGDGISTLYAHNSENLVQAGDIVNRNQMIARVGSTGQSTGPHVHFEVRLDGVPIDPMLVLGKDFSQLQLTEEQSILDTLRELQAQES